MVACLGMRFVFHEPGGGLGLPAPRRRASWLRPHVVALLLPLVFGWALAAEAQYPDTVLLTNGDRLKGEVKGLQYAKLTFKTDAASTIYIKWDRVVEITAPAYFEVETTTGVRYYGSLGAGKAPGQLALSLGDQVIDLRLDFIVRIRPLKQRFWDRLDGWVNVGASYTSSSGIGQGSISASVTTKRPKFSVTTTFDSTITTQPDEPQQSRTVVGLGYTRLFTSRWFGLFNGKFERNTELGIDLRSSVAAGAGRFVVQTNRTVVAWSGGLAVNREIPVEGERQDNVEAFVGGSYSFFTYDTPKTNITTTFLVMPSLNVAGRVRTQLDANVSREIVKDFTVGTIVYYSYDRKPPTEDAKKHDVGVTLTIGWTF
jgi:hypothetical protein